MKSVNTIGILCAAALLVVEVYQHNLSKMGLAAFLLLGNLFMRRWSE